MIHDVDRVISDITEQIRKYKVEQQDSHNTLQNIDNLLGGI